MAENKTPAAIKRQEAARKRRADQRAKAGVPVKQYSKVDRSGCGKKKPVVEGMLGRTGPQDLNKGRDSRFIGWAKQNPIEAFKQADAEAQAGDDWKMRLLKRYRIGSFVDRTPAPKAVNVQSTPRKQAPKPAPTRLPFSQAHVAGLKTAVDAAKTKLTSAKLDLNLAGAGMTVNGKRLSAIIAQKRVTDAQNALNSAEKALSDALAANEAVKAEASSK